VYASGYLNAASDWQKQTDNEGGGCQYECPNGYTERRSRSSGSARVGGDSAPSAELHSKCPNDGSDGDEGQGNDALSPLSGQSRRSVTATVTATERPDQLHASSVRGPPTRRNRHRDALMSRLPLCLTTKHR
jgi:hypothetical protein